MNAGDALTLTVRIAASANPSAGPVSIEVMSQTAIGTTTWLIGIELD